MKEINLLGKQAFRRMWIYLLVRLTFAEPEADIPPYFHPPEALRYKAMANLLPADFLKSCCAPEFRKMISS